MTWRDEVAPGDVIEGPNWDGSGRIAGIVLRGDDMTALVALPMPSGAEDDEWDCEWIRLEDMSKVADITDSDLGRDLSPLAPEYIFMVIRPKRQIETYANLDALIEGLTTNGAVKAVDKAQAVREAAALAIADPGTDIRIPPGASNSPWLRFTQVEGA